MTGALSPWRLRVHESLPSTSDLLRTLAEAGEPEGLAVLARRQTAGRGRSGRSWDSPAGNLYLSALLRPSGTPARDLPGWSLLAGVALADALAPLLPDPTRLSLRWPNDLLLDGRAKCAGVLVDAADDGAGGVAWIVVGFGANLASAPDLPDGRPTAALGVALAPEAVAARVLDSLDRWRRTRLLDGFAPVRAAWTARGPALGTTIAVRGPRGLPVAGRYDGLSEDGRLLLATGGRVQALAAGELLPDAGGDW